MMTMRSLRGWGVAGRVADGVVAERFFLEAGLALGFAAGFPPVFFWTSGRNAVVLPPIVSK